MQIYNYVRPLWNNGPRVVHDAPAEIRTALDLLFKGAPPSRTGDDLVHIHHVGPLDVTVAWALVEVELPVIGTGFSYRRARYLHAIAVQGDPRRELTTRRARVLFEEVYGADVGAGIRVAQRRLCTLEHPAQADIVRDYFLSATPRPSTSARTPSTAATATSAVRSSPPPRVDVPSAERTRAWSTPIRSTDRARSVGGAADGVAACARPSRPEVPLETEAVDGLRRASLFGAPCVPATFADRVDSDRIACDSPAEEAESRPPVAETAASDEPDAREARREASEPLTVDVPPAHAASAPVATEPPPVVAFDRARARAAAERAGSIPPPAPALDSAPSAIPASGPMALDDDATLPLVEVDATSAGGGESASLSTLLRAKLPAPLPGLDEAVAVTGGAVAEAAGASHSTPSHAAPAPARHPRPAAAQ